MSEVHTGEYNRSAMRGESGALASLGAGDWLSLAATPTFAAMALLTAAPGAPDMLCMAAQDASPFSGMASMYLLMSVFHSASWLKLIASRRATARELRAKTSQGCPLEHVLFNPVRILRP